jgi:inorganic pyrophosphatase
MQIEVVIEISKGSRNKYEADDDGVIWLDRLLFMATSGGGGYFGGWRRQLGTDLRQ